MTEKTKPNYSDTLTYGNTKYVNKNMFMSDNENNQVLEDEITRTKDWKKERMWRVERLKELDAPHWIIEHELMVANMTYSESRAYFAKCKEEEKAFAEEYRRNNPMKEEYVNLIYERFDAWFEKYKDNRDKLEDELYTGHHFYEPWFWGSIPEGAEKEFYEHIFTSEDYDHKMYSPVFEVCDNIIRKRLDELKDISE